MIQARQTIGRKPRAAATGRQAAPIPQSLVESATEAIRNRILDLTLPPGKMINTSTLVAELGLSRTPVREALHRLSTEGLIRFESNQGVYVHPLGIAEVNQLCEAFRVCERISASYCDFDDPHLLRDLADAQERQREALRNHAYLDASFWNFRQRSRLAETCRNAHLLDFYKKIANQMRRLSIVIYRMEARNGEFYASQIKMLEGLHQELYAAVRAGDKGQVTSSLMHHLDVFQQRIADALRNTRARDLDLS